MVLKEMNAHKSAVEDSSGEARARAQQQKSNHKVVATKDLNRGGGNSGTLFPYQPLTAIGLHHSCGTRWVSEAGGHVAGRPVGLYRSCRASALVKSKDKQHFISAIKNQLHLSKSKQYPLKEAFSCTGFIAARGSIY